MSGSVPNLEPMPSWQSALFFGIPAALECLAIYGVIPVLNRAGVPLVVGFAVSGAPLVLMLLAAVVAHRLEGRALAWGALRDRLRLGPMRARGWLWSTWPGIVAHGFLNAMAAIRIVVGILG